MSAAVPRRVVVVPIIRAADGSILLCRMPENRGVFPGQWALPGGGVEEGESLAVALAREVREELGVGVVTARPVWFSELVHEKTFPDGRHTPVSMLFQIFECTIDATTLTLNEEFTEAAWVAPESLDAYDLNSATRATFRDLGILPATSSADDAASEIRSATAGFIRAYAAGDLEALSDYYTDDIIKLRHGARAEGKREMLARIERVLADFRGQVDVKLDEIAVHGEIAVVRGRFAVTLTPKAGGSSPTIERRFIELWQRDDAKWRVYRAMDNAESAG